MHAITNWLKLYPGRVVALCVVLHLAVAIPLAVQLNIWIDEAYTLNTTGSSFSHALHQALYFEMQPPLYFLVMNLWRGIDDSVFFGRLFSILCTCGAIVVTAKCGRRILPDLHPGWVAITLAVHPLFVYAAVEMRLYGFLLLLTSLMVLFFWDGFFDTPSSGRARVLFCLCATAALYTQYYAGFLLPAFGGALLILRRWTALRQYLSTMLGVGLLFAPMLLILPDQLTNHPMPIEKLGLTPQSVQHLGRVLAQFVVPAKAYPLAVGMAITLAVALSLVGITVANYKRIRACHILIWTICALVAFSLFMVLTQSSADLMRSRHVCSAFVFCSLSAFCCLSLSPGKVQGHLLAGYASLILIGSISNMVQECRPMAKLWDAQRLAEYVMEHENPGQPILLFDPQLALTFAHYYNGVNPQVPLPRAEDFVDYNLQDFLVRDSGEIEAALQAEGTDHEGIWLLTIAPYRYLGVDFNLDLVDEYMEDNYSMDSFKLFYNAKARLYRRARLRHEKDVLKKDSVGG